MSYTAFAPFYDRLTGNVCYRERAEYFSQIIRKYRPDTSILLDLACGTGSLSAEFCRLGYDVIGVDSSPEMLSAAMQKGCPGALFLCQRMEELDLYGTIDAAVCALDSLNHITDPLVFQRVLDRVRLFLNPGGVFVFDLNSTYKHREVLGNHVFVYDCDEVYCVWQNALLPGGETVEITLDFFEYDAQEGSYRRSGERFQERAYPHEQVCAMLESSGLELLACYGDDTLEPPGEQAQRLIYLAKKPEGSAQ